MSDNPNFDSYNFCGDSVLFVRSDEGSQAPPTSVLRALPSVFQNNDIKRQYVVEEESIEQMKILATKP